MNVNYNSKLIKLIENTLDSILSNRNREGSHKSKSGAGIIARFEDKYLLCLRSKYVRHPKEWSQPGGGVDNGENPKQAAIREFIEETKYFGDFKNIQLANKDFNSEKNFTYYTYVADVEYEFKPQLNWENSTYGWFTLNDLPNPLHHGVKESLLKADVLSRKKEIEFDELEYLKEHFGYLKENFIKIKDEIEPILDDITDEKIGEKKYKSFKIDFPDGARAFGNIVEEEAKIMGIYAPKIDGIDAVRGTKTYERVLKELSDVGINSVSISSQSSDSRIVIKRLLGRGILENPRNIVGLSIDEHPATFDINREKLMKDI